ncbi:MAG TPA: PQQ-binding-like beta-propeller repeat protein [Candidatus Saccharimonadales bacterium]|nr:PQQ-binding-like beta-propeller repeat protein [Candidatus Saccharimonadales bacterium]
MPFQRVLFFVLLLSSLVARAENWPRFRGPTGQGLSSERSLPTVWTAESNVLWKTAIAGEGWSSPIVWGDKVFLTSATESGRECRVFCINKANGKLLWDTKVFEQPTLTKEGKNSYATPTPCTDGQRVYTVFGDGGVAALDMNGSIVWTNREVQFYSRHGLGASPIVHDGIVIMPYDGSNKVEAAGKWPNNSPEERLGWQIPWDKALIVGLDARSGKRLWTARRGLSRIAHITPNVMRVDGADQLISCAGDAIQGFNPKTGDRIWTVYSQGEGVTPSFAFGDGLIYTSSGFEKTTLRTVRTGGKGDVTKTHVAWEQRKGAPTQSSLLYLKPYLYAVTDGGIASCFKAETGEIVYQERIGGTFCASPVAADGLIYFLSEQGDTTVVKAGPEFKILSKNALGEKCQASMAISDGGIFIRTAQNLYRIGK